MAETATIYSIETELSDVDRGVYQTFSLRMARQPSETPEFMFTRFLAYCLEYTEGIAFTEGVAAGDQPAVLVRDLTGRITAWIEVGMPDAPRLHRGSKPSRRCSSSWRAGRFTGRRMFRCTSLAAASSTRSRLSCSGGPAHRCQSSSASCTWTSADTPSTPRSWNTTSRSRTTSASIAEITPGRCRGRSPGAAPA